MSAEIEISSDAERLNVALIHAVLTEAHWSKGISRQVVERAITGSVCFGMYRGSEQVGFARLITDRATFAYLADVFVVGPERGKGYGKRLVAHVLAQASAWNLRRTLLATADAHELYRGFGFRPLEKPPNFMEINVKGIYLQR